MTLSIASPLILAVLGASAALADDPLENTCTSACRVHVSDGAGGFTLVTDADCDSWADGDDDCDAVPNADQADADGDGAGDACDACPADAANDADGDGLCADADNCADVANADQLDSDLDGLGDSCDACPADALNDGDGDGSCADADNCESIANADQADADGDGAGDLCDVCVDDAANDADGDNFCADADNCDAVANADQADADGDGVGDACDACPADAANDADGDGVCGDVDNCAVANVDQADDDGDAVGDACDPCFGADNVDTDGDGWCNSGDVCEGDDATGDDDLDEVCNDGDLCPDGDVDPLDFEDFLGDVDGCAEVCVDPQADASADFSYAANPTATGWTYGRIEAGVFTKHTYKNANTNLMQKHWRAFSLSTSTPRVTDCYAATDCVLAAATIPADALVLQPSDTAQSVARYTVGEDAGEIDFDFSFVSSRTSGTPASATTYVVWSRGGVVLEQQVGSVSGLVSAGTSHTGTISLPDALAGDTVDFVVDSDGSTSQYDWVSFTAFTSCPL